MANNKTQLMAQFYEQCKNKGYTNMRDDTQSLKAKVIATDLGLRYGNIVEFYEKAAQCYRQIQEEEKVEAEKRRIRERQELAERERLAVNGSLLVTISDNDMHLKVFQRPDGTIYCTVNGGHKIEGVPELSVHKGGSVHYTYHPSETVFTGASVGGVMMGGTHQTEAYYTEHTEKSEKGFIKATIGSAEVYIATITISEYVQNRFKRDSQFKNLVTNGKIKCYKDSDTANMFARSALSGGVDSYTRMSQLTMAADARRLPYKLCKQIVDLLGRIIHGYFPPTEEELYDQAQKLAKGSSSEQLMRSIEVFREISYYKDANKQIKIVQKKYDEVLQTEKEQAILAREAQNRRIRKGAVIAGAVLVVIVTAVLLISSISKRHAYREATALMDAGRYEEAIVAFEALGSYEDSTDKIKACKYNDAITLMDEGRYAEAITIFESLAGYKDSIDCIVECNAGIETSKLAKLDEEYYAAIALMDAGNYESAITAFKKLDGYKDSLAKTQQAYYAYGEKLLAQGENVSAAMAFGYARDYRDARQRSFELWNKIVHRQTIAAGREHTVGIKEDGTVVATKYTLKANYDGQCDVSGWRDIVSIAAGYDQTLGLKANGTVVATGETDFGKCDVSDWSDIVAIDTGSDHTLGLKSNGTVAYAGSSLCGKNEVANWNNIIAIAAGADHSVGLKADGTVVAAGENKDGQCDVSGWRDIVAICAGVSHTVGLKADGTVVAVGWNSSGECDVSGWRDIIAICAGNYYTIGLKADGTVVATKPSAFYKGECEVSDWTGIVAICAGGKCTVGLKADGTVVAVGDNGGGACNVSQWTDIKLPN